MAGLSIAPLAGLLALGLAAGCGSAEAPQAAQGLQPAAAAPASQGAAVLRYAGTLPCADCAGIRMELTLNRDASGQPTTYQLVETYLGSMAAEGLKPFTQAGQWSIQRGTAERPDVMIYLLDGGGDEQKTRSFEVVGEQELVMLDREQKRAQSSHSYSLTRVPDAILSFGTPAPGAAGPAGAPGGIAQSVPGAMVTDMAAGWPVTLQIGQELTARLTANRSTGYGWTLRAGSDGGIVAQQGTADYERPDDAPPGAGGVEVFRFKATKPGQTTLAFDYKRAGDSAPAKSVSYSVTVQ
jgi:predicted secreted protein